MEDKKYIQSVICNAWQVLFLKNLGNAGKLEKALDNLGIRYRIKRQSVTQPDGTEVMDACHRDNQPRQAAVHSR